MTSAISVPLAASRILFCECSDMISSHSTFIPLLRICFAKSVSSISEPAYCACVDTSNALPSYVRAKKFR